MLRKAVSEMLKAFPGEARVSHTIETEAWGYESDNPFLNIGVSITLAVGAPIDPIDVLHTIKRIEQGISTAPHRDNDGAYIDRQLDIDLIAIDPGTAPGDHSPASSLVIDTPELTLPHPRMHLRDFVLIPLAETAPAWRHPLLHLTPAEMLASLR